MKKIILIFALVLSIKSIAQTNATVTIVNVTPTLVCPGDTLTISIKFMPPVPGNTNLTVWFDLWPNHTYQYTRIWENNYHAFYSLPKVFVSPDTIYSFKIKTPSVFHGDSVRVVTSQSIKYIDFCANVTGIQELQANTNTPIPIYYDTQGRVIEDPYREGRYNELIFKRVGDTPFTKMIIEP